MLNRRCPGVSLPSGMCLVEVCGGFLAFFSLVSRVSLVFGLEDQFVDRMAQLLSGTKVD